MEHRIFKCLNGQVLSSNAYNDIGEYFNVATNRKRGEGKGYKQYDLGFLLGESERGPLILATDEDFTTFCGINNLNLNVNTDIKIQTPKKKPTIAKTPKVTKKEKPKKVPLSDNVFSENVFSICELNSAGTVLHTPDTRDPRDLPTSALLSLCDFHLAGLKGWAVVTEVIDGDTVDIVFYVPLNELSVGHVFAKYTSTGVRSFIHTQNQESGFFAKLRCRFNECDTMEKNYPEGKFAKKLTIDLYRQRKGQVWVEFIDGPNVETKEKYGRTLIKLYTDNNGIELTDYLYKFNDQKNNILIVENYGGGTKSNHAKNLANRSVEDTEEMSKLLNERFDSFIKSRDSKAEIYTRGVKSESKTQSVPRIIQEAPRTDAKTIRNTILPDKKSSVLKTIKKFLT